MPAVAWAWGKPIFDIVRIVRYQGIVNAFGHVGLALMALLGDVGHHTHPTRVPAS